MTVELRTLCEKFFRTASSTVHTELRQFLTSRGNHPVTSHGWFLDALALTAYECVGTNDGRTPARSVR